MRASHQDLLGWTVRVCVCVCVCVCVHRSLAKLKLNDVKGCLNDACMAVALDPSNVKAMNKRAQAKARLGLLKVRKAGFL